MKTYRTQTKTITQAAATASGTLSESDVQFDRNYDRCIGVAVVERTSSAIFFETGVKSPRGAEIDIASSSMLISTGNVPPDQKYKTINIPVVDGELIQAQLKNGAVVPAGGLSVQFIFLLEREDRNQA